MIFLNLQREKLPPYIPARSTAMHNYVSASARNGDSPATLGVDFFSNTLDLDSQPDSRSVNVLFEFLPTDSIDLIADLLTNPMHPITIVALALTCREFSGRLQQKVERLREEYALILALSRKAGTTAEKMSKARTLDFTGNNLCNADCALLGSLACKGVLSQLERLGLADNIIGDSGTITLANSIAAATGSLAMLTVAQIEQIISQPNRACLTAAPSSL